MYRHVTATLHKQTTNHALFHGSGTNTLFSGETCVSGTLYKTTLFETYSKDSLLNGVLSVHQHFIGQKIFIVPNVAAVLHSERIILQDIRCIIPASLFSICNCQNYIKELSHQSVKYKCLKCVFKCLGSYL